MNQMALHNTESRDQALTVTLPGERNRALIAMALRPSPFPLLRPQGSETNKIVHKVQLDSGMITVTFVASNPGCLLFGQDAFVLESLINRADQQRATVVSFDIDTATDLMSQAGFGSGGDAFRLFRQSLERIGGLLATIRLEDGTSHSLNVLESLSIRF